MADINGFGPLCIGWIWQTDVCRLCLLFYGLWLMAYCLWLLHFGLLPKPKLLFMVWKMGLCVFRIAHDTRLIGDAVNCNTTLTTCHLPLGCGIN